MEPWTDVRWVSEGGVIDCRVLLGPGPHQLFSQYAHLTGVSAALLLFHGGGSDPAPTQDSRPCPPSSRWATISAATATRTKPT